jgi:hypothetical protein
MHLPHHRRRPRAAAQRGPAAGFRVLAIPARGAARMRLGRDDLHGEQRLGHIRRVERGDRGHRHKIPVEPPGLGPLGRRRQGGAEAGEDFGADAAWEGGEGVHGMGPG